MKPKELIDSLPNGLHDANLNSLRVDYSSKSIDLEMDIWIGNLDSDQEKEREKWRSAKISFLEFSNCIIGAPNAPLKNQKQIMIDAGFFPDPKLADPSEIFKNTNQDEQQLWVFLSDTNNFIYISAKSAAIVWNE